MNETNLEHYLGVILYELHRRGYKAGDRPDDILDWLTAEHQPNDEEMLSDAIDEIMDDDDPDIIENDYRLTRHGRLTKR